MFGFQSSSASETASAAEQLLAVLANPVAAQAFLKSIDDKIAEFAKIRDDAMASLKEAEGKAAAADAVLAESKRLNSLLNADKVSLDKEVADLQARDVAVTARENSLNDTAEKIKSDFKTQQAKFDSNRAEFENQKAGAIQALQDEKNAFESKSMAMDADLNKRLSEAVLLRAKAEQDAVAAAKLKADWESKVASLNAMLLVVNKPG